MRDLDNDDVFDVDNGFSSYGGRGSVEHSNPSLVGSFFGGFSRLFGWVPSVGVKSSPPRFDEIHKESDDILAEPFDGLRISFHRIVNNSFIVHHILAIGSQTENPSFSFTPDLRIAGGSLVGRFTPETGSWARAIIPLGTHATTDIQFQSQNGQISAASDTSYAGPGYTVAYKARFPPNFALQYTQNMTPRLVAGIEGFLEPSGYGFSYGGCYAAPTWNGSASINVPYANLTLAYSRRVQQSKNISTHATSRLEFAVNSQTSQLESTWVGGFLVAGKSGAKFNGAVTSQGRVYGLFAQNAGDGSPNEACISGEIDYVKDTYKFGLGLTMVF